LFTGKQVTKIAPYGTLEYDMVNREHRKTKIIYIA
jgi:hypothetical protein